MSSSIIKSVLTTEKAVRLMEDANTLTIVVDKKTSKADIKKVVEQVFGVKVEKVSTLITPDGEKKAYIKLKPEYKATDVAHKLGVL